MTRQQRLLNQLRKLEEKITIIHDELNDTKGSADKLTQLSMHCYVLAIASVTDIESLIEDDGGFGEG